jgi:hypothetical protein
LGEGECKCILGEGEEVEGLTPESPVFSVK